jgi:hypothetical protein
VTAAAGNSFGGGVYVVGAPDIASFTMKGGEIAGNSAASTSGSAFGGGVYVGKYGTFTMESGTGGTIGTISNNTATINGGGVYVGKDPSDPTVGGTFTMKAGTISDNKASGNGTGTASVGGSGGGVSVNGAGATFTMTGGSVEYNGVSGGNISNIDDISNGGGVSVKGGGQFIMGNAAGTADPTIRYNATKTGELAMIGGGVSVNGAGSKFTMYSGIIEHNWAGNDVNGNYGSGGGVNLWYGAEFIMGGGSTNPIIRDNSVEKGSQGGGIQIAHNSTFTMYTGIIENNTAKSSGGGVAVTGDESGPIYNPTFNMEGGVIQGNKVTSSSNHGKGGGVSLIYRSTFTMKGGTIYGNDNPLLQNTAINGNIALDIYNGTGANIGTAKYGGDYGTAAINSTDKTLPAASTLKLIYVWVDQHDSLVTTPGSEVNSGDTLTITMQGDGYTVLSWHLDGVNTGQKGLSYNFSSRIKGKHVVGVLVRKGNKIYNTNIPITVN